VELRSRPRARSSRSTSWRAFRSSRADAAASAQAPGESARLERARRCLIVDGRSITERIRCWKDAPDALRTGMSGLAISFAKQLNKLLGRRRGRVWHDRFHSRELRSPSEVRSALVYVFRNLAHHGTLMLGDENVDRFSSAPRFEHFTRPVAHFDLDVSEPWPRASPHTWHLDEGWWKRTRQGLLDPNEVRRRGA
jgi:hypothetical protein